MPDPRPPRPWARALLFVALSAGLYALLSLPAVRAAVLEPWTVQLAGAARALLSLAGLPAGGEGNVLSVGPFAVAVLDVCNGSDIFVLFSAAVLAAPAPWWPHRALGLLAGLPLLAALNLLRVLALVLTGRYLPALFELSHQFLWQLLLVAATAGLFVLWLRCVPAAGRA